MDQPNLPVTGSDTEIVGVLIVGPGGSIRWANEDAAELSGCTVAELTGATIGAAGGSGAALAEAVRNVLSTGVAWTGTAPALRRNGDGYTEWQSVSPLDDPGGRAAVVTLRELAPSRGAWIDSLPLPYLTLDSLAGVMEVNQAWLDAFGFTREQVRGRDFESLLAPESRGIFHERFPRFLAAGRTQDSECMLLDGKGAPVAVAFDGKAGRDASGNVVAHCQFRVVPHTPDDGGRWRSHDLFETLVSLLPDVIVYVTDTEGVVRLAEFGAVASPHLDLSQFIGKRQDELFPPGLAAQHMENFRRVIETGEIVIGEDQFPDGNWREYRLLPLRRRGVIDGVMGISHDITHRKLSESALRTQNERLQRVIEETEAAYFRIGLDGRYEDVNRSWLRLHCMASKNEIVGHHYSLVQVPDRLAFANDVVARMMRGERVSGEATRRCSDGSIGYHTFSANPVFSGGRVVGVEGFLVDITKQRLAEESRQRSETHYRALFDSMHEGVAVHRLTYAPNGEPDNYVILDVNRRFEEIVGIPRADAILQRATDVYGTAEAPYLPEYAHATLTRTVIQFETYFAPMDKHFSVSVAPMGDELFATIFFDVTDLKRAAERLRRANFALAEAEQRYRLLFNSTHDAIFVHGFTNDGLPGPFLEVNDVACARLGYSREELLAMSPEDIDSPEGSALSPAIVQRLAAGELVTWEGCHVTRDGRPVPVELVARSFEFDGRPCVFAMARDISERKAAMAALRETEERYRLISENTGDVIWLWDWRAGMALYVSPSVYRLRGYTPEEVLAQPWDQAQPRETYERVLSGMLERASALESGDESARIRMDEVDFTCADGSTVITETVTTLLSDDAGKVCHVLGVSRDISERLKSEAERHRLETRLLQAQKLESIGRLAGGIAHDFNNLLTVINGYGDFLVQALRPEDPLRTHALEICGAGARAASLTKQLLAFSRKQVIAPKVLNINGVVRETERMLRRVIGEDVQLSVLLAPDLGNVIADPDQLHQVLMNLVVNARDAMPDGGNLTISTARVVVDGGAAARYPDAVPGRYVLLSVTDTGIGMDAETSRNIFEPFFTTKDAGFGTGLGLATVYGIVRQAGGWIAVDTEPGQGTAFHLHFPEVGLEAAPSADDRPRVEPTGTGETVLVVEDHEHVRRFTSSVLKSAGYVVLEAPDAESAEVFARGYQGQIDLLLTDVILPGANGRELATRLVAARPGLRVIYTSGYTADVIARRGVLDSGVTYLPKPFAPAALLAKVREVVAGGC